MGTVHGVPAALTVNPPGMPAGGPCATVCAGFPIYRGSSWTTDRATSAPSLWRWGFEQSSVKAVVVRIWVS